MVRASSGPISGQVGLKRVSGANAALQALPVYLQLSSILRQQIKDGHFGSNLPFPTEMQLASRYHVSRVTVRRALETLVAEQLVVRRHGVGTFVSPDVTSAPVERAASGTVDSLISLGLDTSQILLEYSPDISPPAKVLQALGLEDDDTVLKLVRLRSHQSATLSVSTVYLPHTVSHLVPQHLLDDRPVVMMLEEGGAGPHSAEQTISAVPADDKVARWLGIGVSMPVIRLRRTIFNVLGQPIEHYVGLYNPDNYEYHMKLTREVGEDRPRWRHVE